MTAPAHCKSCGAAIEWARTVAGKAIPLEPAPDGGNIDIGEVTGRAMVVADGKGPWRTHFQTCPAAAAHRRRRAP